MGYGFGNAIDKDAAAVATVGLTLVKKGQDKKDFKFQDEMNSYIGKLTYKEAVKKWGKPTSVGTAFTIIGAMWNYVSPDYSSRYNTHYGSPGTEREFDIIRLNDTKGEILSLTFDGYGKKTLQKWSYTRR